MAGPRGGQRERRTAAPPETLRGLPPTDDRPRPRRPREGPRNGHRRNRTAVTPGDRPQRVAERQVAAELRLLKLRAAAPPIVLGERGDPRGAEAVRQDAGLHRAVRDHPGGVLVAPRNLAFGGFAPDEGEGC